MRQLPADAKLLAARVRVTIDCPECASPIPVNGLVARVLCGTCRAVVDLDGGLGWDRILTYQSGEPCMEHKRLMNSQPVKALDYFMAGGATGCALYRKWRDILVEIDARPASCAHCGGALDAEELGRKALGGGSVSNYACPHCSRAIAVRVPQRDERAVTHSQCLAIVGETAPRGALDEPETTEAVLFSCLGCGAPLRVDATVPRVLRCEYCEATSYLPDALWLRLHPAQRKRPFYLLMISTDTAHSKARRAMSGRN